MRYAVARDGLRAEIVWSNGRRAPLRQLLLEELLPLARRGLRNRLLDHRYPAGPIAGGNTSRPFHDPSLLRFL